MKFYEHGCSLFAEPATEDYKPGSLHLCECGRLYVLRDTYGLKIWRPVEGKRWWRR